MLKDECRSGMTKINMEFVFTQRYLRGGEEKHKNKYGCCLHSSKVFVSSLLCATSVIFSIQASACTGEYESKSLELFSFEILHHKMVNKIFGKRSVQLCKVFTTTRLLDNYRATRESRLHYQLLWRIIIVNAFAPAMTSSSTNAQYVYLDLICS